ncbi:glycoside hydrolase family 61 protein [Xylariaceae sp. FL0255]|nr:glycoside hydrolase family 61 protein [Xylariaceae sp. FL0255]
MPSRWLQLFWWLLPIVDRAFGHGGLANYTVGDTWYRGFDPFLPKEEQEGQPWLTQRTWDSINPVFEVNDTALACNTPALPPPSYIPIAAGENLTAVYWYWLHPIGPMSVWLASCGEEDCQDVDVNELEFFKIWEGGLIRGNVFTGVWYQRAFQKWNGDPDLWPVTIPPTIKPGLYVVRHEILSLHVAAAPQWYPQCAHINITGNGLASPPASYLARFPGAYADDDPMVKMDVYKEAEKNTTEYTVPGPPVWDG